MSKERGSLSINSENIFPIIKKWLYSDHDIFFREIISNGVDAITKLKKLEIMGEIQFKDNEKFRIDVIANPEDKTIKFIDNGIGMTADEVKEYINQIAFSGAKDFVEKYKDKTNDDQIIGHFGLGFYSAFMVANKVTIDTLSWQEGSKAVHWESDGETEFEMSEASKSTRGTEITLYLNDNSYEFCNEYRAKEVIEKYCSFMPEEIYFSNASDALKEDDKPEEIEVDEEGNEVDNSPKPINETKPLWTKHPNDCTDEDYKKFYREVFHDYKEPLFWIHLNMDYPFNLKGILYFPKINTEYDSIEGKIKLYNNQVFIADNIKEVIPEFLMLLKGVIDCPDLPLNVSRSALQNDGFVKKISDYITKKVADKLSGMFKVDKENYEKFWDDISPFIKFGCLKDDKFAEKMKDYIIFKNLEGDYTTLPEYVEKSKELQDGNDSKDEVEPDVADGKDDLEVDEEVDDRDVVYYVTDIKLQSQYINMFKEEGIDAILLTHNIDQPFISYLEQQNGEIKFQRIDSDLTDNFKEEADEEEEKGLNEKTEKLTELFRKALDNEKLSIKVEKLKNDKIASMITLSEENRRMQEMMKMYSMPGMPAMDADMFGGNETLVLNVNNKLVQYLINNEKADNTNIVCEQLYDLALLSYKQLEPEAMTKFIQRSNEIMMNLI
ncbi:MAG TPA: molecular chaperone HtpG [Clostridiales bacterium]|nr:molecular chaperone HtpG [Clostridiales bacterium]